MPIDAFPDVTNTQIIIITQWNGKSAEEVERFVTSPIEISMNSVQKRLVYEVLQCLVYLLSKLFLMMV